MNGRSVFVSLIVVLFFCAVSSNGEESNVDKIVELKAEIAEIGHKISGIDEAQVSLRAEIIANRKELDKLRQAGMKGDKDIRKMQKRLREMEEETLKLRTAIEKRLSKNELIKKQTDALHTNISSVSKKEHNKRELIKKRWSLEGKLKALEKKATEAETDLQNTTK